MRDYNLQDDNNSTLNPDRSPSTLASGTAMVLAGQMSFVLCGYLLHSYLSRAVDPIAFGNYGVIINVLTWIENALNNGVPWAVRKFLPVDPRSSATILREGLRWQMAVAGTLYIVAMFAAPWLTMAMRDSTLTFNLRLALTDILLMALYTLYRAALNGFRLFAAQGASMAAYAVGKLAFSLLLVRLGYSLTGALIGNVLGTVVGWLAAILLLQRKVGQAQGNAARTAERGFQRYTGHTILGFALPTALFTLTSTFLTSVGLIGVKALLVDDTQVGYFVAANYLANAPTLLLVAFSLTLFPHLAESIANRNGPLTRLYIRSTVRYLGLVVIPGIALVIGTSRQLISLVYPTNYTVAAPILNLLIISAGLYNLYMVFADAILAEGRVLLALGIPGVMVPVSLAATWYLTGRLGAHGAAYAAVLTTGLCALAAAAYVLRRFAVQLNWSSMTRASAASLLVYGLTRLYAVPVTMLFLYLPALVVLYLVLLCLLGELQVEDLKQWPTTLSAAIRGMTDRTRA